jgi:YYY domain-containing protein
LINQGQLGPLLFEADHCQRSPWWQLLMLYGFFTFFIVSFLVFIIRVKKIFHVDQFVLLLIILATLLILLPEIIYVKDIYPAHYRANTMFKLVFQAFMLLSLASGYILIRILSGTKKRLFALIYLPVAALLVSLVLLYPYQAVKAYYGNLQNYQGLHGTTYLKNLYPDDYAAIQWLNTAVYGQPVILEAQGDSYTDYARVSANTGLPTVLGWTVHEWLWRGTYDIPAPRIEEVKKMYEEKDINETKKLLDKYSVKYIFIGALERQKYPNLNEEKFEQLGKIVFQQNKTKIFQITAL